MFPSLIGRLRTISAGAAFDSRRFPSLIGRLRTSIQMLYVCFHAGFPSLIGRLRTYLPST